ncbi:MAG: hypothetical protein M1813_008150 [Trichoglossum hirsutum]|nr:MAG: hypothetical protein M1813_008150 [Trichoglossum hirsutum]
MFNLCAFPCPSNIRLPFLHTLAQQLHLHLSLPHNADGDDIAPFRLLVFGDPQLEGDTSIPTGGRWGGFWDFPALGRLVPLMQETDNLTAKGEVVGRQLRAFVEEDVPRAVAVARKMLDLWGNDYYLAHIYRTMRWWTKPTHVVVLGDLLGSQWIDDEEFGRRGERFWNRVFRGGRRVGDDVTMAGVGGRVEVLGKDEGAWSERVGCVVGNHDAGYAGDMTEERVERFERVFGGVNWDVQFQLPGAVPNTTASPPTLHLITLNSLNLDSPALSPHLQNRTHTFLNTLITTLPPTSAPDPRFTVLLTHLPLHKPAGTCADAPFFSFHDEVFGGGVREQNHLSEDSSRVMLDGLFGMNSAGERLRNGIILTGHDHEGCDVYHHPTSPHPHLAANTTHPPPPGSLREITVRSMMGSYSGNAGLLSVWFDRERMEWNYDYSDCRAGVQHWWWGVHALDLVTGVTALVVWALSGSGGRTRKGKGKRGKPSARKRRRKG